jgi:trans-aconitate methyltransferase
MDSEDVNAKNLDVYSRNCEQFDAERSKTLFERKWLEKFQNLLPHESHILDVGCGSAEPIARFFIEQGIQLTGIDFSPEMIKFAKSRFPDQDWIVNDMRNLDLGRKFDGLISWHSFFHLTQSEQRTTLVRFANHLKPNAPLMLTVGTYEGNVIGHVCKETVYHSSLSPKEYRDILSELDIDVIEFVAEDPECGMATIILARKISNLV